MREGIDQEEFQYDHKNLQTIGIVLIITSLQTIPASDLMCSWKRVNGRINSCERINTSESKWTSSSLS